MSAFERAGIGGTWREDYQAILVKFDLDLAIGVSEWPLNRTRMDLMAEERLEESRLFNYGIQKPDGRKSKDVRTWESGWIKYD
jgi:hypothetical protein